MAKIVKSEESSGRFDFLGISKFLAPISVALTFAAAIFILVGKFNYGVDFAGGTELQVQFTQPVDAGRVRQFTTDLGYKDASVQAYGSSNEYLIRIESPEGKSDKETNDLIKETIAKLTTGLTATFTTEGGIIRRVDTVGPQVGKELKRNGILAGFYCLLLILIYIGLRFDYKFAPGAVFCLFHDAILTLGIFAIMRWEVTVQTMAAVLTIIGYSLNDTIVIFDRIRENMAIYRDKSLFWIANKAVNDCLSRTILTFFTTFMTVVAMYILAGGVIREFALTMMIGMVFGIYSTVYVATPLVLLVDRFEQNRKATTGTR